MLATDYSDFDVLVCRAKDVEHSLGLTARSGYGSLGKRAIDVSSGGGQNKRQRDGKYRSDVRRGGYTGKGSQGRGNQSRVQYNVCWNCGSREHMRQNCPRPVAERYASGVVVDNAC